MRLILLCTLATLLAACGGPTGNPELAAVEAASRELQPSDQELADIYNRSCRSCHTVAATGAPLVGDTTAWNERMEKGPDVLLENVISGFRGMPPFGLCMDCNADEFEALILFMSRGK